MPPLSRRTMTREQKLLFITGVRMVHHLGLGIMALAPSLFKEPLAWHNSALSGYAWTRELIEGHPMRIQHSLGVSKEVYTDLVMALRNVCGLGDSKYITLEEQTAIFLYTCTTGLSIRHVGERFQHSNETISKYFKRILVALSSPPFYTKYVSLPKETDPVPEFIRNNPRFYPFFKNALGAIDGTHIPCTPSAAERDVARDRKGGLTQNCLACCSFDLRFLYFVSGWDGSAADATMFSHSRLHNLRVPSGKYYIADAGFGYSPALLLPYRGVRYHLAEWGRANERPVNKQELYNLRHATARNCVERIFGIIKKRWDILTRPPRYPMDTQVRIPPALAALHNFITIHDPEDNGRVLNEIREDMAYRREGEWDDTQGNVGESTFGDLDDPSESSDSRVQDAQRFQDSLADAMWTQYLEYLNEQ